MTTAAHQKWFSIQEIAERFGVHPATIRRLAKKKGVPIAKIGAAHRIREEHVKLLVDWPS